MVTLDPPPTQTAYEIWNRTATRPLTQGFIGEPTAAKRQRSARLSKLWTPERTLRMFRRVTTDTDGAGTPEEQRPADPDRPAESDSHREDSPTG